jgi:hypothetical protein
MIIFVFAVVIIIVVVQSDAFFSRICLYALTLNAKSIENFGLFLKINS